MKRSVAFLGIFIAVLAIGKATAHAHVLVRDESGDEAMILHITPNDDPVVGQEAVLFMDIAGQNLDTSTYTFNMTVYDSQGGVYKPAVEIAGPSALTARFVFAQSGTYTLRLTASSQAQETTFVYVQHITRGRQPDTAAQQYVWAEVLIAGSATALCVLGITMYNRRGLINAYVRKQSEGSRRV